MLNVLPRVLPTSFWWRQLSQRPARMVGSASQNRHACASVEVRARRASLKLAEEFGIARGSRTTQSVVRVELEHEGTVGLGEAAPVYYRGETIDSAAEFLAAAAPPLLGDDPFALEAIGARLAGVGGEAAARAALDAALHDWVGKRLDVPVWRLLGLSPEARPTSYTIGIDTVEGTRDRARRARAWRALKVKVGGTEDLARLEAVRAESGAALRVDANEGWTLESARELMPALLELGVELVEQPFPADDLDSFRALGELDRRLPVVVDEGCHDLGDVAAVAGYADGINIKLAKSGGLREALRMIAAARALGLGVMLGCMVESQLGIAPAAAIASLADWVDLDGHLLLADEPFTGLRLEAGRVLPGPAAGLGVAPAPAPAATQAPV
jgi:L-Ala-D/L-Glu epimerase